VCVWHASDASEGVGGAWYWHLPCMHLAAALQPVLARRVPKPSLLELAHLCAACVCLSLLCCIDSTAAAVSAGIAMAVGLCEACCVGAVHSRTLVVCVGPVSRASRILFGKCIMEAVPGGGRG
jgi:hypothetical protein